MARAWFEGKVAVVTGAASGIGLATARAMAEQGARLAVCDVDQAGLGRFSEELRRDDRLVCAETVDVRQRPEMERFAAVVHDTLGAGGAIDILVNNAGIGVAGAFVDVPLEEWDRVIGINLSGVAYGCHAFVPKMIARGRGGHVVNIASMAGYTATAGMASYHASKFGVIGLSEALRLELDEHGIGVTAICPGVINTPIVETARGYGEADDPALRQRVRKLFQERGSPPEKVAKAIVRAIRTNPMVAPVTIEAHAFYWLKRMSPGLVRGLGLAALRRTRQRD
jgi:NAD(P)-dependent dehydrogenase (short-subunit alcohol dehydrogenase family)